MCVRELQSACSAPSLCDLAPERVLVHVVRERSLAVDLDDRDPLPVARFELRHTADVDLLQIEVFLGPERYQLRARPLAEVAVRRVVEDDPRDKARG